MKGSLNKTALLGCIILFFYSVSWSGLKTRGQTAVLTDNRKEDIKIYIGLGENEPFFLLLLYIAQLFILYFYISNTLFYKEILQKGKRKVQGVPQ